MWRLLFLQSVGSRVRRLQYLQHACSVIGAYSAAGGVLPDWGSSLCLLHWQVDSLPLSHQGTPTLIFCSLRFGSWCKSLYGFSRESNKNLPLHKCRSKVCTSLTYMIEQGPLWGIPGRLVSQWLVPSRGRLIGLLSWEEASKQRL